jgi:hypothetical protein
MSWPTQPKQKDQQMPATSDTRRSGRWRLWSVGLAAALLLGAAFRLIWVDDIEYKEDEAWMFARAQEVCRTGELPVVGQPSSVHLCTPGMSVWVFALLNRLTGARVPTDLARGVQLCNVLALVLVVAFAWRAVPAAEREAWRWAAAMAAVNPLAVLFQRKLWMPSLFPLLSLSMLTGWWHRHRRWGAFLWGLVAACLGQIQMSGFFFAAGFAAWAFLFDRKNVRWLSWLAGSSLGAVPLIPWVRYVLTGFQASSYTASMWAHLIEFKYWLRWVRDPIGTGLNFSLGGDFAVFAGYPLAAGRPTHLVGLLHALVTAVAVVILCRAAVWWWRRREWGDVLVNRLSPTAFTINAALWGFGLLLTASACPIHRHYLIILFPLTFVWLARLALPAAGAPVGRVVDVGRALLLVLVLAQAAISAEFLYFVHTNPGPFCGDYGAPYRLSARSRNELWGPATSAARLR